MLTQEQIKEAVADIDFGECLGKYVRLSKDGSEIAMVYRKVEWEYHDGEVKEVYEYKSYSGLWMGSGINRSPSEHKELLMEIE